MRDSSNKKRFFHAFGISKLFFIIDRLFGINLECGCTNPNKGFPERLAYPGVSTRVNSRQLLLSVLMATRPKPAQPLQGQHAKKGVR